MTYNAGFFFSGEKNKNSSIGGSDLCLLADLTAEMVYRVPDLNRCYCAENAVSLTGLDERGMRNCSNHNITQTSLQYLPDYITV